MEGTIAQILSWICHWTERRRCHGTAAAGARDPPRLAAVADYGALPVDMLQDILLRLPADEVCRLRLICRAWQSLTSSDPHFTRAHAARHPLPHVVIVVRHHDDDGEGAAAEVRDVDIHGNVIKLFRIRRPVVGPLSVHGDLLCASHGWGLTSVVDMATGAVADVGADPRKKVKAATPHCVLGHVPATGEYKVLRIQADYCCRRRRQRCDVVTLGGSDNGGGGGDAGRWRLRTCPPVTLRIERPWPTSWNVAVVAGLAYFLTDDLSVEADRLAVFDLAAEAWKPATLRGPLTAAMPNNPPHASLLQANFQLARLGECLVVLYCNTTNRSTGLCFLEDTEDGTSTTAVAARWSRRYVLPFAVHDYTPALALRSATVAAATRRRTPCVPPYHYPLAVLDDGRILVWVNTMSVLGAYDPETCSSWTDLATLAGDCVVGMHHASLLCSGSPGAAQP